MSASILISPKVLDLYHIIQHICARRGNLGTLDIRLSGVWECLRLRKVNPIFIPQYKIGILRMGHLNAQSNIKNGLGWKLIYFYSTTNW